MYRILKELKPFIMLILIIIGLLFFQAMAELALPDYMSHIVNVGIQQNGIENAVPQALRKEDLDRIGIFLNGEERDIIKDNYILIRKENLSDKEYDRYSKRYPILEEEDLYILDSASKEDLKLMDSFLTRAILAIMVIEEGLSQGLMDIPEGVDPFIILSELPEGQFKAIREKLDEKFADMPTNMQDQLANNYIKSRYELIGLDVEKIQSSYILYIGRIMLLIALLGTAASISVGFLSSRISASLGRNLRDKVFSKATSFSNAEFDRFSTASLITRSTNDIQQIQMFIAMLLRLVFYAPILGAGGVIRALSTNVSMAWTVGLGVIIILILVVTLFAIALPRFKRVQKLVDRVNLVMREALNGQMVIRAFNTQGFEENKFDKANRDLTKTNLFVSRLMVTMMPTMMLIMNGIILLIIWVGAREIDGGTIQVGDMMAFMQYAMQIIMSFLMISMISIILPRASVSAQRIGEVLDTQVSITDPIKAREFTGDGKGLLEFKDVSFKYPNAKEYVLKGISFAAKPGEITAFIGSTGSGKSTLINLIPRFYDVTEGQILIDGLDIRDVKLGDLRERIGYIPQRSILFAGDIEGNLKYGKNSDAGHEDILKAIEIAQAQSFIESNEKGILSDISQGGTNVSGGQRQRLSIARALVKKPDLFIFDDSFSALDYKTDAALRKAMANEIKNKTVLIVAQRINTIRNAEKIIVLDEGKIAGIGTHKELLMESNVYRQIALSQLSEEELTI